MLAYLLYVDVDDSCIYLSIDGDIQYRDFDGKRMPKGWQLPPHSLEPKILPLRDFVEGELIFISDKGYNAIKDLVGDHVEFINIGKLKGENYYVINVLTIVDCLDLEKSKTDSEGSNKIKKVYSCIFKTEKIPDVPIFRIPQDHDLIFVTKPFVDCITKNRITGVGFSDPAITTVGFRDPVFDNLPILE